MTPLRLFFLSLLLVGAGVGLWMYSAPDEGVEDPDLRLPEAGEDAFLSGDPRELLVITIEHPEYGRRVRAVRGEDGRWRLTEPMHDSAEPATVQAMMSALWTRDWKPAPESWQGQSEADLGLDDPRISGEVEFEDGTRQSFRIGAADVGGRWYACMRDEQLLALGETALLQLQRPAQQWRDHRVQPFGAAALRLSWEPREGTALELVRRGTKWYLEAPVEGPVDEGAMPFLARMLGARATGLGESPPADADTAARIGVLRVLSGQGEEVVLELWPGGVKSSEREYLIGVDYSDFRFLFREVSELLSRRLLDFEPDQVMSMRVEAGERERDFRLHNGGWMAEQSEQVDPEVDGIVRGLLSYATAAQVEERLPLPERPPDGRLLFSISRRLQERGATVLQWWVQEDGTQVIASEAGGFAAATAVNFERGVESLLDRFE